MTDCCICKRNDPSIVEYPHTGDGRIIECPLCGKYKIAGSAEACIQSPNMNLATWVRDQNEHGQMPIINSYTLDEVNKLPDHSVLDKLTILLRAIERRTKHPGFMVDLNRGEDYPLAWASCDSELYYLIGALEERGLIERPAQSMGPIEHIVISSGGWEFLSSLEAQPAFADQAFVAMWFNNEMDDAWSQGIKPAVEQAGYRAIRVDKELHVERIDAKIVADIKDSRFLIADVTGQRAGVYFEAGYAIGLNRPVIWCVRKDQLDDVHFDTRQYNHIVWETPDELKEKLYQLIRAVIGARVPQ